MSLLGSRRLEFINTQIKILTSFEKELTSLNRRSTGARGENARCSLLAFNLRLMSPMRRSGLIFAKI